VPAELMQILYYFSDAEAFLNFKYTIDCKANLYYIYYKLPKECKKLFKEKLEKSSAFIKERRLKILSDVDDTFVCSGGTLGNVDGRYPKEVIYPGVTSFYKELAPNDDPPKRYGNLIFISARPEVTRQQVNARFADYYQTGTLHTLPLILFGDIMSMRGVPLKNYSKIAEKKFKNFCKYAKLYPEYNFVFVGDNGQGDFETGELMLKSKYAARIKGVFIHRVHPKRKRGDSPTVVAGRQIHYFENYIEAATKAFHQNLIDRAALNRILVNASDEFENIQWDFSNQKKLIEIHFIASCKEANQILEGFQDLEISISHSHSNIDHCLLDDYSS
jgi:phosphatidate phosphatase APP1